MVFFGDSLIHHGLFGAQSSITSAPGCCRVSATSIAGADEGRRGTNLRFCLWKVLLLLILLMVSFESQLAFKTSQKTPRKIPGIWSLPARKEISILHFSWDFMVPTFESWGGVQEHRKLEGGIP